MIRLYIYDNSALIDLSVVFRSMILLWLELAVLSPQVYSIHLFHWTEEPEKKSFSLSSSLLDPASSLMLFFQRPRSRARGDSIQTMDLSTNFGADLGNGYRKLCEARMITVWPRNNLGLLKSTFFFLTEYGSSWFYLKHKLFSEKSTRNFPW